MHNEATAESEAQWTLPGPWHQRHLPVLGFSGGSLMVTESSMSLLSPHWVRPPTAGEESAKSTSVALQSWRDTGKFGDAVGEKHCHW